MEFVSVIIPVYNVEDYLDICLTSIQNQTYKNIEIILVDDGSTDQSGVICDRWADNCKNIKTFHKQNGGVSSARNYGLSKMSERGYVLFVDPDDYVAPDYVSILISQADESNNLVTCKWYNVFGEDKNDSRVRSITETSSLKIINGEDNYLAILEQNTVCGYVWNKLFCKEIILKNNLRFYEAISICEDLLFCIQYLSYIDKVTIIGDELYFYVRRNTSASYSEKFIREKFCSEIKALGIVEDVIPDKYYTAKRKAKIHLLQESVYYWVRLYKAGIFEKPTIEEKDRIKKLFSEVGIPKKKYKLYFYFVMYAPRVLFFCVYFGNIIRRKRCIFCGKR